MSLESVTQFFQQEAQDPTLQEYLQSATERESVVNKVTELGKEKGYDFTPSEAEKWLDSVVAQLKSQADANADGELNEDELEAVAGGATPTILLTGALSGAASFFTNKGLGKLFGK